MTVGADAPFTAEELEPTLRPLLEASLLPQRAYVDESRRRLGGAQLLPRRLDLRRPRVRLRRARPVRHRRGGRRVAAVRRRARLLQRLPPPRRPPPHQSARARPAASSARTTRGATASTARSRTRPTRRSSRASTRPATACARSAPRRSAACVFADPSGEAGPLADHVGSLADHLDRYRTAELRRAARIDYDVKANWKAIVENYSECLHCPGVHPELNRLSHYLSGDDVRGPRRVVRRLDDAQQGARRRRWRPGGGTPAGPTIAGVDPRKVLYFAIFPNTPDLVPPRLRDAAHAVAARRRPHRGRLRVALRA